MGKYQTRVEKDIAFVFVFCGGSIGYFLFLLTIFFINKLGMPCDAVCPKRTPHLAGYAGWHGGGETAKRNGEISYQEQKAAEIK